MVGPDRHKFGEQPMGAVFFLVDAENQPIKHCLSALDIVNFATATAPLFQDSRVQPVGLLTQQLVRQRLATVGRLSTPDCCCRAFAIPAPKSIVLTRALEQRQRCIPVDPLRSHQLAGQHVVLFICPRGIHLHRYQALQWCCASNCLGSRANGTLKHTRRRFAGG
jgi:hypothetical protein